MSLKTGLALHYLEKVFNTDLSPDPPNDMAQLKRDAEDIFAADIAAAVAATPMMAETIAQIEKQDVGEEVVTSYVDSLPKSNKAPPQAKADYGKFVACSVILNRKECRYDK